LARGFEIATAKTLLKMKHSKTLKPMNGSISPWEDFADPGRALLWVRDDRAARKRNPKLETKKLKD